MPSLIPQDLTGPGTHGLVIGVSHYLHMAGGSDPTDLATAFDMEQLSAAARSASEFAAWLLTEYKCARAPLRSLRVLLSPADGEQIEPGIAALLAGDSSASLSNVREALLEFRQACDAHTDNVAMVYIAGHGVQLTKHGAIVLLTDFGARDQVTALERAVDVAGVHAGMNHPGTASTQFWFVDACRQQPSIMRRFETLRGGLQLDVRPGDSEVSPIFLAATTGKPAYARVGGITLFNEALMWSLRGGAAVAPEEGGTEAWHVSVSALIHALPRRVKELAYVEGADQSADIAGKTLEATVHEFSAVPEVDLCIHLTPSEAENVARATLKRDDRTVFRNARTWPVRRKVEAGLYYLTVSARAPYAKRATGINALPPEKHVPVDVTP